MNRDELRELLARQMALDDGRNPDAPVVWTVLDGERNVTEYVWHQYLRKADSTFIALNSAGLAVVPVEPTEQMSRQGVLALVSEIEKLIDGAPDHADIAMTMRSSRETDACYKAYVEAGRIDKEPDSIKHGGRGPYGKRGRSKV